MMLVFADTSNFDHFDEAPEDEFSDVPMVSNKGSDQNMPFVGFTFKRYEDKRPALGDMFGACNRNRG
jgi:hypothetical protein